ncbi:MAG: tol-pal system-associated acyl-CoA thioesterase [Hyphomicrobiales bacterium]|nr:tol-pal system-associated acyl-CoA thioesterase [Hyphomicrobiales bacterium]MCP5000972.1 tol-pal system-associated acyl-CoA thioesterase [Hyphomicrobiales bacterium]
MMEAMLSEALSGRLEGNRHRLLQRVYYEDTDFSGVVYHARYLHFMERGRTDYLRCLGVHQGQMAETGDREMLAFVVRHMEIDFRSSARMDDVLEIVTQTGAVGGARLVLEQEIRLNGKVLISAVVTVAIVNRDGRPRRLPANIAELLAG